MKCIEIFTEKKIPFLIGLNKLDRIYQWKSSDGMSLKTVLSEQSQLSLDELENKANQVICKLAEMGLNGALYYKNADPKSYVSMVPFSSKTGEGLADLVMLIVRLTQKYMRKQIFPEHGMEH